MLGTLDGDEDGAAVGEDTLQANTNSFAARPASSHLLTLSMEQLEVMSCWNCLQVWVRRGF